MAIPYEDLPYASDALAPHVSAETFSFHHGKHYKTYVDKGNGLIEGTDLADASLEDIVLAAHQKKDTGLFNNAAQAWNHAFFWKSMSPNGGGDPTGAIADKINEAFGSADKFREEFAAAGAGQFGSGWVWLVADKASGGLKIVKTGNADTPITDPNLTPLITCDVWEHAYYLDYQNARPKFLDAFLANLINWDFANANLG